MVMVGDATATSTWCNLLSFKDLRRSSRICLRHISSMLQSNSGTESCNSVRTRAMNSTISGLSNVNSCLECLVAVFVRPSCTLMRLAARTEPVPFTTTPREGGRAGSETYARSCGKGTLVLDTQVHGKQSTSYLRRFMASFHCVHFRCLNMHAGTNEDTILSF